jgi:hypothetical protein
MTLEFPSEAPSGFGIKVLKSSAFHPDSLGSDS